MKVSPKKKIPCKFGVGLFPDRIYDAEPVKGQPKRIQVLYGGIVHVIADKKNFTVLEK